MRHSRLLLLALTCLLAVTAVHADIRPTLEPLAQICECTKAAQCHYLSCPRGTRPVCLCSCECR